MGIKHPHFSFINYLYIMSSSINNIISIMRKYTPTEDKEEMGEQDSAASTGGGDKSGYPNVTKWETGLTRGPANQIGNTKWSDIVKINRGKGNTLL